MKIYDIIGKNIRFGTNKMDIKPIAKIENAYDDKFGIPRQSGIADIKSRIVLNEEYDSSSVIELEGFSHLWIIWGFSKNKHDSNSQTVRPPRLGGNKRVGVFASRSPFRPNPLGLSSVRLEEIKNENGRICLIVSGADMVNGTPIYDIKPYIRFTDSHEDARCGYVDENEFRTLEVEIDDDILNQIDDDKRELLISMLENDPRPAYRNDDRIYGFKFDGKEIKFKVKDNILTVKEISNE